MKAKILVIAIALVALTGVVSAQDSNRGAQKTGSSYVDANKDGVCDNKGKAGKGERKGPKDGTGKKLGKGQGKCDGSGAGKGNFVDANKDGVCDNKK